MVTPPAVWYRNPFALATLLVFAILVVPELAGRGMFFDGLRYFSTAKNMAMGEGSLFSPRFAHAPFYLQLPLVPGMMATFFLVFGDHWWVDKLYNLTLALACWGTIIWIWHEALKAWTLTNTNWQSISWWPALLTIVAPSLYWGWKNGVTEPTVSLFGLLHVALLLRYINIIDGRATSLPLKLGYIVAGGMMLFFSFYAKPPLGLFTLCAPFLLFFFMPPKISMRSIVTVAGAQTLLVAVCSLLLYSYSPARENLHLFFSKQWLPLVGQPYEPRKFGQLSILLGLLNEILLMGLVVIGFTVLAFSARIKLKRPYLNPYLKPLLFFTALGLCGSLPLALTATQYERYLIPALPFFAIGIALANGEMVYTIQMKALAWRGVHILYWVLIAGVAGTLAISISNWGKPFREKEVQHDLALMAPYIVGRYDIALADSLEADNEIRIYAARFYDASIRNDTADPSFMVTTYKYPPGTGWEEVKIAGQKYQLYRKKME